MNTTYIFPPPSDPYNYCSKGDKIFSDYSCLSWAKIDPAGAETLRSKFYKSNLQIAESQDWCKANGGCDSDSLAYCKLHPSDPYCACINSKVNKLGLGSNPACLDAKCVKTGYKTANMRTTCPNIVDCSIVANLSNSGVALTDLVVNQNCANPTENAVNPTENAVNPIENASSISSIEIILFVFIIFILLFSIIIYIKYKKINTVF